MPSGADQTVPTWGDLYRRMLDEMSAQRVDITALAVRLADVQKENSVSLAEVRTELANRVSEATKNAVASKAATDELKTNLRWGFGGLLTVISLATSIVVLLN